MNEVYLVTYHTKTDYISSTLYAKKETADKVAKEYNEQHADDIFEATVTCLPVIQG